MAAAEKERSSGFNTPAVVLGGLAAIIFVFALSLFLEGGYNAARNREMQAKIYSVGVSPETEVLLAEQQDLLNEKPRYINAEAGIVCIPIEDAMARVVARNAK